jgi:thiamine pyrophosphate-dependent acetolactate synthase large subunit-like protein
MIDHQEIIIDSMVVDIKIEKAVKDKMEKILAEVRDKREKVNLVEVKDKMAKEGNMEEVKGESNNHQKRLIQIRTTDCTTKGIQLFICTS